LITVLSNVVILNFTYDVPLVITDSSLWKRAAFSQYDRVSIRTMTDSLSGYTVKVDSAHHILLLTPRFDSTATLTFVYTRPAADRLVLTGHLGRDSIAATFKRVDETKYLLMSRGFHWIQEQPFNR
jgi:hypothetical protein